MTATADEPLIGVINAGSSSLKFSFYEGAKRLLAGQVDGLGARPAASATGPDGEAIAPPDLGSAPPMTPSEVLPAVMPWARQRLGGRRLAALGHRVVHGGMRHSRPARVTPELLDELEALVPLAPLHEPHNLAPIRMALTLNPELPQVACFDTAFHRQMPEVARRFALPRALWDEGLYRYGFHGISYEYIMEALGRAAPARVVIAHLGNGASMAAVRDGRSVDTTMGFTPAGGFMMGTRSGDLDPGLIVYLINQQGYDGQRLERLVYHQSGLLGVSGISSDVKTLLEKRTVEPNAALALEMFCYQMRKHIGALAAVLGGLDLLVFTGGIGERAAPVRLEACRGLEHVGIKLDKQRNEVHADPISSPDSTCIVRVIPANEDLMIARHTHRVIFGAT
jgi:acetate kinase